MAIKQPYGDLREKGRIAIQCRLDWLRKPPEAIPFNQFSPFSIAATSQRQVLAANNFPNPIILQPKKKDTPGEV